MTQNLKKEGQYNYIEVGEGQPIIVLHGLMGGLSNFDGVVEFFSKKNIRFSSPHYLCIQCLY